MHIHPLKNEYDIQNKICCLYCQDLSQLELPARNLGMAGTSMTAPAFIIDLDVQTYHELFGLWVTKTVMRGLRFSLVLFSFFNAIAIRVGDEIKAWLTQCLQEWSQLQAFCTSQCFREQSRLFAVHSTSKSGPRLFAGHNGSITNVYSQQLGKDLVCISLKLLKLISS